jgi:HlyD family secretion protein
MSNQNKQLFRQSSLERLSSPEQLDQLMQVVKPRSWIPLSTLGCLVAAAVVWSIFGRIPVTVEGRGVLIYPNDVVPLQSKSSGQILDLRIQVGDRVERGQVIGTLDQTDLQKQFQQQQAKLKELQSQDQAVKSLQGEQQEQERRSLQQQRQFLQQRIVEIQNMSPTRRARGSDSIEQQRLFLEQSLRNAKALTSVYQQRLETRRRLAGERIISSDMLLEAETQYLQNSQQIADLQAQLKELTVRETDEETEYVRNLSTIADLQAQLKTVDSREATLKRQDLEASTARQREIQDVQREIARLQVQLRDNSQIVSQHSGRVLELTLTPGQVISAGARIGAIETEDPAGSLVGMTFFTVGDGKKVQPGMTMQITPQTVRRERFGGIVGTITQVSSFPITREAAANVVGNAEVVSSLVAHNQEGLIQVASALQIDPATHTGYRWSSSRGPQIEVSSGTTTLVRVKVDERAPITYVLPILRSTSGIY